MTDTAPVNRIAAPNPKESTTHMSDLTGLEALALADLTNVDALNKIAEDLAEDFPAVALAMAAMTTFLDSSEDDLSNLFEETLDLRRSHVLALAALLDGVRSRLAGLLAESALNVWTSDAALDPAVEALRAAGGPLRDLVKDLHDDLTARQSR
ncbi:hypothetical protein [Actinomadura terrae]|uniref:hypothetical protein n=1 Tax=Actinomadura terrae TaxID=604353 RepID=UPI001FA79260|nr:hypothetical protein [Actinomadura terrae]